MLVALTEQQQLFQLNRSTPQEQLQALKKTAQFYCPQCKALLILKIGQIKIPHFAHVKKSDCDALFSEGESYAHLLGKQHLQELFQQLQLQPVLEPYLPAIQQRPDLLITKGTQKYAIEFQCSRLSPQKYQKRTEGYKDIQIMPMWIIQTPNEQFKSRGLTKLSINHTNAQYIQMYKNQKYLLSYDVHSRTFYYISNLLPIHGQQYFGYIQSIPLMKQLFPFFVPKKITENQFKGMLTRFLAYRFQYLHARLLLSRRGVNDTLLRAIYELKLTVSKLPNFIGIPLSNNEQSDIFCVEWQLQLFYFMERHQLTPQTFHLKAIPYFLEWSKMLENDDLLRAVTQYLMVLRKLEIETIHGEVPSEQLFSVLYEELFAIPA
ncbi:competence protein CoiA [Solibacillus sp. FSL K6-1523]|uniref:competence protein CoiA n=1 Tax=Solibacillus sp. FSL K6-1523 TaxID=2921471 RepID=UPI0030FAFADE